MLLLNSYLTVLFSLVVDLISQFKVFNFGNSQKLNSSDWLKLSCWISVKIFTAYIYVYYT